VPGRLALDAPPARLRLGVELVRRPLRRKLPQPRPAPLGALLLLPHAQQPPPAGLVLLLLGHARGGSLVVLLPLAAQRGRVALLRRRGRGRGHRHKLRRGRERLGASAPRQRVGKNIRNHFANAATSTQQQVQTKRGSRTRSLHSRSRIA